MDSKKREKSKTARNRLESRFRKRHLRRKYERRILSRHCDTQTSESVIPSSITSRMPKERRTFVEESGFNIVRRKIKKAFEQSDC